MEMAGKNILEGDWQDYDDRKLRDNQDKEIFLCDETWERNFLINKIHLEYPEYAEIEIRKAVSACCEIVLGGRREELVNCVMRRLMQGN